MSTNKADEGNNGSVRNTSTSQDGEEVGAVGGASGGGALGGASGGGVSTTSSSLIGLQASRLSARNDSLLRAFGSNSKSDSADAASTDRQIPVVVPKPRTTSCTAAVQLPKPESAGPSKPAKKRSRFWSFLKRGHRTPALPLCVETDEGNGGTSMEASGCFSRSGLCGHNETDQTDAVVSLPRTLGHRRGSPTPDSPSGARNLRHLSFGAGSHSMRFFDAQLMTVVVPAPPLQMLNDLDIRDPQGHVDLAVAADSSMNPIGYPHLHFSQSMSSSSSSSSSGISAPLAPAPPTPDYPPLSVTNQTVHTQVDYMHCLVPDLLDLTNRVFYWGVMDRYEAERLLEGRPEGTFLVRDSAQEEFLFSVSFRRYGRSLHARIEQWNHRFSFDSHDLGVFAAPSVCALVEHYKDPAACMFFEPMLTLPLTRTYAFTLQHLCRAVICSRVTYDNVSSLRLPQRLQDYLKYYHYKQRICVRRFEAHSSLAD